jgi:hypothetical protein
MQHDIHLFTFISHLFHLFYFLHEIYCFTCNTVNITCNFCGLHVAYVIGMTLVDGVLSFVSLKGHTVVYGNKRKRVKQQQVKPCNCSSSVNDFGIGCDNETCTCFVANRVCTSKCHKNKFCSRCRQTAAYKEAKTSFEQAAAEVRQAAAAAAVAASKE